MCITCTPYTAVSVKGKMNIYTVIMGSAHEGIASNAEGNTKAAKGTVPFGKEAGEKND